MEILYSDKDIVVCVKPVGMDSEHEVPAALGGEIFPIHRLDKNVGGVMVYARTKVAAAALSKAVQEGTMVKEYVAKVHGTPPESGDWTDFLFKDSTKNKVFVVKKERKGVKKPVWHLCDMGKMRCAFGYIRGAVTKFGCSLQAVVSP